MGMSCLAASHHGLYFSSCLEVPAFSSCPDFSLWWSVDYKANPFLPSWFWSWCLAQQWQANYGKHPPPSFTLEGLHVKYLLKKGVCLLCYYLMLGKGSFPNFGFSISCMKLSIPALQVCESEQASDIFLYKIFNEKCCRADAMMSQKWIGCDFD